VAVGAGDGAGVQEQHGGQEAQGVPGVDGRHLPGGITAAAPAPVWSPAPLSGAPAPSTDGTVTAGTKDGRGAGLAARGGRGGYPLCGPKNLAGKVGGAC